MRKGWEITLGICEVGLRGTGRGPGFKLQALFLN